MDPAGKFWGGAYSEMATFFFFFFLFFVFFEHHFFKVKNPMQVLNFLQICHEISRLLLILQFLPLYCNIFTLKLQHFLQFSL